MRTTSGLTINLISGTRHGLEVFQVTVNGVLMHEFLSRPAAMAAFKRLVQKYS